MGILWDLYMKTKHKDNIHKPPLHLESETDKAINASHINPNCERKEDNITKER